MALRWPKSPLHYEDLKTELRGRVRDSVNEEYYMVTQASLEIDMSVTRRLRNRRLQKKKLNLGSPSHVGGGTSSVK
jgi:hypothetical protein